jgi:Fe-S cluster biogenesis protein NfuA
MQDKEKVIKGLETCSDVYYGADGACSSCPYSKINGDMCVAKLVHDAISMLKEQEQRINELEEKLRLLEYGDQDTLQSGMMPAT